ncbi:NIPSNAP family protein [Arenibacter sp. BSSL-BM3]|uniref:NIPSNAP family protein n=1 Tax=Arenibacter arenosicollis TaxID=2762274 RepID=A0ABR7QRM7_9FLAO|nr:NIPSNAP family protein [Arenibacter arenosicollis]MBC8769846.1 NIPSNAP family protein [Arenibacter arenosicollis]
MNRRILSAIILFLSFTSIYSQEEVYELRTYELEFFGQAKVLHNYLEQALLPALDRQGIEHIGAFEEYGESLPKKIYLLIPYDNIQTFQSSKDVLAKDAKYLQDAKTYLNATEEIIPYKRISTNLIRSSAGFPKLVKPVDEANLFELRIYESHNEDALRRKVKMFNDSEFKIFEEVGLPMVFFGENIAGDQMPCLTYMLAFKDMEAHTRTWAKFGPHPEWQRIIKLEEYANAMNDITRVFLKQLPYSKL